MPWRLPQRTPGSRNSFRSKSLNNWHIRLAAHAVKSGGVIAYPTEAVFGLGCSPWNEFAVQKLLCLKGRPPEKGLIVVAACVEQLHSLVNCNEISDMQTILETWPGPVTWVLPTHIDTPSSLSGAHTGLAVRVSAHPLVRELCKITGPLVSTSANLTNTKPARTTTAVRNYFGNGLDYILPGKLGNETAPSEIRQGDTGAILRRREVKNAVGVKSGRVQGQAK